MHVQSRLAVGHEREVVDRFPPLPDFPHPRLDLADDLIGLIEGAALCGEPDRGPDLTVDARVAAGLGRNVVDPKAPPEPRRATAPVRRRSLSSLYHSHTEGGTSDARTVVTFQVNPGIPPS